MLFVRSIIVGLFRSLLRMWRNSGLNKITVHTILSSIVFDYAYFCRLNNLCLIYLHHICKHRQYKFTNSKDIWVPCSHHHHLLLQGHQFNLPPTPTVNTAERALVSAWKTYYLKWEENNSLEFEEKDKVMLVVSWVQLVYCKVVIQMQYYSEIWWAILWNLALWRQTQLVSHFVLHSMLRCKKCTRNIHNVFDKILNHLHVQLKELETLVNSAGLHFHLILGATLHPWMFQHCPRSPWVALMYFFETSFLHPPHFIWFISHLWILCIHNISNQNEDVPHNTVSTSPSPHCFILVWFTLHYQFPCPLHPLFVLWFASHHTHRYYYIHTILGVTSPSPYFFPASLKPSSTSSVMISREESWSSQMSQDVMCEVQVCFDLTLCAPFWCGMRQSWSMPRSLCTSSYILPEPVIPPYYY